MFKRYASLALVVLAACGDDGGNNNPTPDAPVGPTCATVGEISSFPGTFMGTNMGGGADLTVGDGACATQTQDLWFDPLGEDVIVKLTGLTAGKTYVVNMTTTLDLSFYVTSTCPMMSGAVTGCLNFTDALFQNETGVFVADGPEAYLVVDAPEGEQGAAPAAGPFELAVAQAQCTPETEATDCAAPTPFCTDYQCVQCQDDFDCTGAAAPVCGATGTCGAGPAMCVSDDAADNAPGDDGPASARDITPAAVNVPNVLTGSICSMPETEADFYKVTVAAGQGLTVSVAWTNPVGGTVDIDPTIVDANNVSMGFSFYLNPENVRLTYLPAGTYYIRVQQFEPANATAVTAYTITATLTAAQTCTTSADCAAEYKTQLYRGDCTGGVCQFIAPGTRADGMPCDSGSDCMSGGCSYIRFEADAQKSVCTKACTATADCAAITGTTCTTGFQQNFCVPSCANNLECGVANLGSAMLDAGEPWNYLTCTVATGVCGAP